MMNQLSMRARALILIFLFVITKSPASFACHWSGGEIWYEFNGKNYTVHHIYYTACQTCIASSMSSSLIEIKSASLNQTLNVTLKFYSKDTLMTGCPGDTNSCNSLLAPISGYMRHHYADTISIPPANDWILSTYNCCRNNSNLVGGSSNNIYFEATLDNSVKENTSALVSGDLALTSLINDTTYFPVWSNDADGDSITLELIAPMTFQGTSATYNSGFSATMPLGAGSVCEFTSNYYLKTFNPNTSNPAFAMLVKEYRNGKLISSRIRDIQLTTTRPTALSGKTHTTPPYIANGTNLSVTTCPGKANSVMLSFLDSTATDIVDVDVITPNLPGWTFNKTITPGAGRANVLLSWTTPTGLTTLPQFSIALRAKDNECPNNTVDYSLAVKTIPCAADSVWPGDANSDNVVNLYDPLAIAIAFAETGAARTSPNILWAPQYCSNWNRIFPVSNVDMKHADCNGNGTADNTDLTAVNSNYGNVHDSKKSLPAVIAYSTNSPLFLDTTGIIFEAGKTLQIPIVLGTAAIPISNGVYGIATSLSTDIAAIPIPSVSASGSWLAAGSSTMVTFSKNLGSNTIDWAHARTTHTNMTGYGKIGTLSVTIPATTPDNTPINISFANTRVIDSIGREIILSDIKDLNTTVKNKLNIANSLRTIASATIVPNPSAQNATLMVALKNNSAYHTDITDITGRMVWQHQTTAANIALPAQQLHSGIYFVKITTTDNETLTLKWVKE